MIKRVYYKKLIRDKVPDTMSKLGVQFETKILDDKEYRRELLKKAEEESSGLVTCFDQSKDKLISELADVHDVLSEIQKTFGVSDIELQQARNKNRDKKGGFETKTYLEWSEDNGYQTNEKKGSGS